MPDEASGFGLRSPHALVGLVCGAAIGVGMLPGTDLDLTPSAGLGYALGIVGLSSMVLLLGYSLRKRARRLRELGPIRRWLELHLMLGLLGPTAILYHANFELGSLNSTVSLACALTVAGSGIGGRFLYGRMHRSLAGPRRTTEAYDRHAAEGLNRLREILEGSPGAEKRMRAFVANVRDRRSAILLPVRFVALRPRAWRARRAVLREISRGFDSRIVPGEIREAVETVFADLCRGFELRIFEMSFVLWHAIHVPLTVLLFVSAAIHVVAVHLF